MNIEGCVITKGEAQDAEALVDLYRDAFPDEDLTGLIRELLKAPADVVSFVARRAGAVVGHVALSRCAATDGGGPIGLLGPFAVAPALQRKGLGMALVEELFRYAAGAGMGLVLVLGDPAYYGRYGFRPEEDVEPAYPLPDEWREAWQSVTPGGGTRPRRTGRLIVPAPWRRAELWGP